MLMHPTSVLYLRSFRSDREPVKNRALHDGGVAAASLRAGLGFALAPIVLPKGRTMTEILGPPLRNRGVQLLQVNPRGNVEILNVSEDHVVLLPAPELSDVPKEMWWQAQVAHFAERVSCIVVAAGDTWGLAWELLFLRRAVPPQKLVVLAPKWANEDDLAEAANLLERNGYEIDRKRFVPETVVTFSSSWKGEVWQARGWSGDQFWRCIESRIRLVQEEHPDFKSPISYRDVPQPEWVEMPMPLDKWQRRITQNVLSGGLLGLMAVLLSVAAAGVTGATLAGLSEMGIPNVLVALFTIPVGLGVFYAVTTVLYWIVRPMEFRLR